MSDTIQERLFWAAAEAVAEIDRLINAQLSDAQYLAHEKEQGYERVVKEANDLRVELRGQETTISELRSQLAEAKAATPERYFEMLRELAEAKQRYNACDAEAEAIVTEQHRRIAELERELAEARERVAELERAGSELISASGISCSRR